MPDKTISNPSGYWGMTADANPDVKHYTNNSAGTVTSGDVVVFGADVTGGLVTTTTTVNDKTVVGVVAAKAPSDISALSGATYAVGATVPVIIRGHARVNIASNTVVAGDLLTTSGVAKVAVTNAGAPAANAVTGSIIGVALQATAAKDANNTIVAYINKT